MTNEIHLMCLTQTGSLPIFTKRKGNCENLAFSIVASLNSTNIFCKSQGIQLNTTFTKDWTLIWRDYLDSVTLIAAGKNCTEKQLNSITELIFHSFLLFINPQELGSSNVFEKMKREAKNYMPIVDKILDNFGTDLPNYDECQLLGENFQILQRLNEFSLQFGFCAVVIDNKIAVASEGWWDLDVKDRKLLVLLMSTSLPGGDAAVFLPIKSPQTAYRFVTVPLRKFSSKSLNLCVICGAEPSYHEINLLSQQIFESELLCELDVPRSLQNCFEYSIFGILLINKLYKKYVILENTKLCQVKCIDFNCQDILRKFSHEAIDMFCDCLNSKFSLSDENEILEQYWTSDLYKCYCLNRTNGNQICVLFDPMISTQELKFLTENIYLTILEDISLCW